MRPTFPRGGQRQYSTSLVGRFCPSSFSLEPFKLLWLWARAYTKTINLYLRNRFFAFFPRNRFFSERSEHLAWPEIFLGKGGKDWESKNSGIEMLD